MGSEMCIRDSHRHLRFATREQPRGFQPTRLHRGQIPCGCRHASACHRTGESRYFILRVSLVPAGDPQSTGAAFIGSLPFFRSVLPSKLWTHALGLRALAHRRASRAQSRARPRSVAERRAVPDNAGRRSAAETSVRGMPNRRRAQSRPRRARRAPRTAPDAQRLLCPECSRTFVIGPDFVPAITATGRLRPSGQRAELACGICGHIWWSKHPTALQKARAVRRSR